MCDCELRTRLSRSQGSWVCCGKQSPVCVCVADMLYQVAPAAEVHSEWADDLPLSHHSQRARRCWGPPLLLIFVSFLPSGMLKRSWEGLSRSLSFTDPLRSDFGRCKTSWPLQLFVGLYAEKDPPPSSTGCLFWKDVFGDLTLRIHSVKIIYHYLSKKVGSFGILPAAGNSFNTSNSLLSQVPNICTQPAICVGDKQLGG